MNNVASISAKTEYSAGSLFAATSRLERELAELADTLEALRGQLGPVMSNEIHPTADSKCGRPASAVPVVEYVETLADRVSSLTVEVQLMRSSLYISQAWNISRWETRTQRSPPADP